MNGLTETLAAMRDLAERQATAYTKMLELNGGVGKLGVHHPDLFDAMIRWDAYTSNGHADVVLTLLSAVENVLALHVIDGASYGGIEWCVTCQERWPCATYRALTDALGDSDV